MQGIIFLIIVIWAINRIAKARKKASRKAQNRIEPAMPQNAAPVKQTEQPAAPVKSAPESAKVDMCGMLNESDKAPTALDEGNSRTCDHGSIGGSMEAADHQGMGEAFVHAQQQVQTRVKAEVETKVETKVKTQVHVSRKDVVGETHAVDDEESPVAELTPEQMRRAVVMAEILKRPCERQRRWSAR